MLGPLAIDSSSATLQAPTLGRISEDHTMHIAILTFEGYNELDSLIALGVLNRVKKPGWRVSIASPTARVRSMNGVVIESQSSLAEESVADAVLVGSGFANPEVVPDKARMAPVEVASSRHNLGP